MHEENTTTLTGSKARKRILRGINEVYDAVKITLGPKGRNALLPRTMNRGPRNTNDGVTISENVRPKEAHARQAASFFKEAAKKTNEVVGDGTTTTTVIAGHLTNKIFKDLPNDNVPAAGTSTTQDVMELRKLMKEAKQAVLEAITASAQPIKSLSDLQKIAEVSIEDPALASPVAQMVYELGIDNHIEVVEGYKNKLETEIIKGMRFPAKVAARAFLNKLERFEMVAEDTAVLITNHKLDNPYDLITMINNTKVSKLAIIAPNFSQPVLQSLVQTIKNGIYIYPVYSPALRTEQMEDIAIYTDGIVVDKDKSMKLSGVTTNHLGFAEKIVVKDTEVREDAALMGGRGEKIKRSQGTVITEYINTLKAQVKESQNPMTKASLEKRIASLHSAIGVIRVGATTEAESLYQKLKIEDGVYACKAALEGGYVKGGGLALKEIADTLPGSILTDTLREPYAQIQANAGSLIKIGKDIIDPAKVVALSVEHGVSIAQQLITTDISIAIDREETPADGYKNIALAINSYAYFYAKQQGMLNESEMEQEKDMKQLFDESMFRDQD